MRKTAGIVTHALLLLFLFGGIFFAAYGANALVCGALCSRPESCDDPPTVTCSSNGDDSCESCPAPRPLITCGAGTCEGGYTCNCGSESCTNCNACGGCGSVGTDTCCSVCNGSASPPLSVCGNGNLEGTGSCDDGLACTGDGIWACGCGSCSLGPVVSGCVWSGACYAGGATQLGNPCKICNGTTHAWDNVANGPNAACADAIECTDDVCTSGACTNPPKIFGTDCADTVECFDAKCNGGVTCDPTFAFQPAGAACTDTTPLDCFNAGCNPVPFAGTCGQVASCRPGQCCEGGSCYANGDLRPSNDCQVCFIGIGWVNVTDGPPPTSCLDDGKECTSDQCLAGSCTHPFKAGGTLCTADANVCSWDVCSGGACTHNTLQPFPPDPCDPAFKAANPCWKSRCGFSGGLPWCLNTPDEPAGPNPWCVDTDGLECTFAACDGLGSCDQMGALPNGQACTPAPDDGLWCTTPGCIHDVLNPNPNAGTCSNTYVYTGCAIGGTCYAFGTPADPPDGCSTCESGYPTLWTPHYGNSCSSDGNACTADVCGANPSFLADGIPSKCTHPTIEGSCSCPPPTTCKVNGGISPVTVRAGESVTVTTTVPTAGGPYTCQWIPGFFTLPAGSSCAPPPQVAPFGGTYTESVTITDNQACSPPTNTVFCPSVTVKDFTLNVGVPLTAIAAPRFPGESFATSVWAVALGGYTGNIVLSLGPTAPSNPFSSVLFDPSLVPANTIGFPPPPVSASLSNPTSFFINSAQAPGSYTFAVRGLDSAPPPLTRDSNTVALPIWDYDFINAADPPPGYPGGYTGTGTARLISRGGFFGDALNGFRIHLSPTVGITSPACAGLGCVVTYFVMPGSSNCRDAVTLVPTDGTGQQYIDLTAAETRNFCYRFSIPLGTLGAQYFFTLHAYVGTAHLAPCPGSPSACKRDKHAVADPSATNSFDVIEESLDSANGGAVCTTASPPPSPPNVTREINIGWNEIARGVTLPVTYSLERSVDGFVTVQKTYTTGITCAAGKCTCKDLDGVSCGAGPGLAARTTPGQVYAYRVMVTDSALPTPRVLQSNTISVPTPDCKPGFELSGGNPVMNARITSWCTADGPPATAGPGEVTWSYCDPDNGNWSLCATQVVPASTGDIGSEYCLQIADDANFTNAAGFDYSSGVCGAAPSPNCGSKGCISGVKVGSPGVCSFGSGVSCMTGDIDYNKNYYYRLKVRDTNAWGGGSAPLSAVPAAYWRVDEPTGSTVFADASGNGNSLSCAAGLSGAAGFWKLDEAVGATVFADSSGNGNSGACLLADPVGYWKLNETVSPFADSAGNGNTGSCIAPGCPTYTAAGKIAGAQIFDGIDDLITVSDSPTVRLGTTMTVGAWVNVSAASADWARIVGKGPSGSRNYGIWREADGDMLFQIYDGVTWCNFWTNGGLGDALNIPVGSGWHHVVATYNGTTGRVFIDGVPLYSSACSVVPPTPSDPLTIGYAGYHTYFNGLVDDVQMYNTVLADAQIASLFAAGTAGNEVTFCPAAGGAGAPGFGSAPTFDGKNDAINMSNPATLNMTSAFSVAAWIYPTGPGSGAAGNGGVIVNKEGEYQLFRYSDGTIRFTMANTIPGWTPQSTGFNAPLSTWTHLVWTYSAAAGRIYLYVNGSPVPVYANLGASGSVGDFVPSQNDFRIGGRQFTSHHFDGKIDDVRVYNRELSATEVSSLFACTVAGGAGKIGLAGTFDGVDDRLTAADFGSFTNFTVSAWVNRTAAFAGGPPPRESIVSYKEGDAPNCGFVLSLNETGTQYPRLFAKIGGAWLFAEQSSAIPLGTWVHLAGSYDSSTIKLYRDGALVASTAAPGAMTQCTQGIGVGNRAPGTENYPFPGLIDEVRIYGTALTAADIETLADSTNRRWSDWAGCVDAASCVIYQFKQDHYLNPGTPPFTTSSSPPRAGRKVSFFGKASVVDDSTDAVAANHHYIPDVFDMPTLGTRPWTFTYGDGKPCTALEPCTATSQSPLAPVSLPIPPTQTRDYISSTNSPPRHTYDADGTFPVTMRVTDSGGHYCDSNTNVDVKQRVPTWYEVIPRQ